MSARKSRKISCSQSEVRATTRVVNKNPLLERALPNSSHKAPRLPYIHFALPPRSPPASAVRQRRASRLPWASMRLLLSVALRPRETLRSTPLSKLSKFPASPTIQRLRRPSPSCCATLKKASCPSYCRAIGVTAVWSKTGRLGGRLCLRGRLSTAREAGR